VVVLEHASHAQNPFWTLAVTRRILVSSAGTTHLIPSIFHTTRSHSHIRNSNIQAPLHTKRSVLKARKERDNKDANARHHLLAIPVRAESAWAQESLGSDSPENSLSAASHLPLELQHTIKQRLSSWRTSRNVNIDRHNTYRMARGQLNWNFGMTSAWTHDRSREPPSRSSGSILLHWHTNPWRWPSLIARLSVYGIWRRFAEHTGLGHLVVDLAEGGSHLVCQCPRDNHDITLSGTGAENDTQTILIVAGGSHVHHFNGTAGQTYSTSVQGSFWGRGSRRTESHRPHGALSRPVRHLIECRQDIL